MKEHAIRLNVLHLIAGAALLALPSAMTLLADDAPVVLASKVATQPATASAPKKDAKREEEIARVMDFLKTTQPDLYEQALTFQEKDPARFNKVIGDASGTVRRLEELKRRNPKLFDLEIKNNTLSYRSMRLARELNRADISPETKEKTRGELRKVLLEQFGVMQQIRQLQIDEAAQRLKDLEKELKDRETKKDALIEDRIKQLISRPKPDW